MKLKLPDMKKTNILIYLALILLLISCEKEPYINLGFDSPINKNSSGLVIADISNAVESVNLNGFVFLLEGEVELILLNPRGISVYSRLITGPVELRINESFDASPGYWKLKYLSREGVGGIDLHLNKELYRTF